MRHGKKFNHLGRKAPHRKAMLSNMANSLIEHKRITTTLAKAKALRKFVEPIVTKAKQDTMHSRRVVFSYLNNKEAVKELYTTVVPKISDRPGGYTRILKLGTRPGDNAEMAFIEFVDFNELAPGKVGSGSAKKKRRRRGSGKKKASAKKELVAEVEEVAEEVTEEVVEEKDSLMDKAKDVVEDIAEEVEEVVDKIEDAVEEIADKVEDAVEDAVESITGDDDDEDDDDDDDKKKKED